MQVIQDSITYATDQQQTTSIQVFTDNQAALQALKDPANALHVWGLMTAS